MASQELITGLNHALNREVSTALRYMLQASAIKGAEWEAVRTMYLQEVSDEMGHAQYLTNTISALGGRPTLAPDLTPPPADVRTMLTNDVEQERVDVQHYLKMAALAEREGFVELKLKMEEQAADEDLHAQAMTRMLG